MQSTLIQILGQTTGQRAHGEALLPAIGNEQLPPDTRNAKVFRDVFVELSTSAPMIQVPNAAKTEPTLATDAEPVPSADDAAAAGREAELTLKTEKTPLELPQSGRPEVHSAVGVQTADQVEPAKEMHPLQPSDIVQKQCVMHRSDVSFSPLANTIKEPTFLSTTDAAEPDPDIVLSNSPIKGAVVGLNDTTPSLHHSAAPERTPMSNQKADAAPQPIQAIRSSASSDAAKAEYALNAPAKAALGVSTNFGQASVKTATMLAEPPAQQLTRIPISIQPIPKTPPVEIKTETMATGTGSKVADQPRQIDAGPTLKAERASLGYEPHATVRALLTAPSESVTNTVKPVSNAPSLLNANPAALAKPSPATHPIAPTAPGQPDARPATMAPLTPQVNPAFASIAAKDGSEPLQHPKPSRDTPAPPAITKADRASLFQPSPQFANAHTTADVPANLPQSRNSQNGVQLSADAPIRAIPKMDLQQIAAKPDLMIKDQPIVITGDVSRTAAEPRLLQGFENLTKIVNIPQQRITRSTSDTAAPAAQPIRPQPQAATFQAKPATSPQLESKQQAVSQQFFPPRSLGEISQQENLKPIRDVQPSQMSSASATVREALGMPMQDSKIASFNAAQLTVPKQPEASGNAQPNTEKTITEAIRQAPSQSTQHQVGIPATEQWVVPVKPSTPDVNRRFERSDSTPQKTPATTQVIHSQAGLAQPLPTQQISNKLGDQDSSRSVGQSTLSDAALSLKADGPNASAPHAQSAATRMEVPAHVARQMMDVVQHLPNKPVEISLNPEELGKLRLSVSTSDAGLIVSVVAERPETLDLLRRHIATLGQEFQAMGYKEVSFSFNGNGSNGSQPDDRSDQSASYAQGDAPPGDPSQLNPDTLKSSPQTGLDLRL